MKGGGRWGEGLKQCHVRWWHDVGCQGVHDAKIWFEGKVLGDVGHWEGVHEEKIWVEGKVLRWNLVKEEDH